MEGAGGLAPALFVHITLLWAIPSGLHMIEDPVPHPSKNFVLFQSRSFGTRPFEELRSSRVSGFQPSISRSPGMIT